MSKMCHQRHESDELDVFEAAGYYSGYTEANAADDKNIINGATRNTQKPVRELLSEKQYYYHKQMNWRSLGGRNSLDVSFRNPIPQQESHSVILDEQILKENSNKYKQPSSPGGRLASFLNSLFNQAGSKKKKKKTTKSTKDVVVDEESPGGWRRRRRSSISNFSSSSTAKTNVINNFSSGNSGFRTPPPYAPTPTKRDFRSFSDHHHHLKQLTSDYKPLSSMQPPLMDHHEKVNSLRDVKSIVSNENDGYESDSSSDLFELQNYDLGLELDVYSSGLPVYETTRMDSIKRETSAIS